MAPLFDSHCHFAPGDDIAGALARAREAGLSGLLAVGGDAAADAGADGLDRNVVAGGHRCDTHVAAEVFDEHPAVAVIAEDLLHESI